MRQKLRGIKRRDIHLDFDLYRVDVPIVGLTDANLSVIDIWPEGATQTIMLVHGYAGCAETWEFQINHFSRDYRVIAPDLRGHGQSDAPFTRYTMTEMVTDLHQIVETLNLPPQFVLVGHSFGGSICVEYATAHPERLAKLVLLATAGEYPLPKMAAMMYRFPAFLLQPLWPYRPRWNAELHVMKRMMTNNLSQWRGWDLMRAIQTPTLVVTGERDRYFPRYVFEEVGDTIPHAEVYDVGSAKHKIQLERYDAVNRVVRRFVEERQHASWRDTDAETATETTRPWLKAYRPETPATVPVPRQPLHKFLESAADWVPNQTAVQFFNSRLSYRQLDQLVNQFAHILHGFGVQPGDRVMVVLPNIPQLIVALYATLRVGGTVVLPNPDAAAGQIVTQVKETRPKVLVTLLEFGSLFNVVRAQTDLQEIVLADIRQATSAATYKKLLKRWQGAGFSQTDGTALPPGVHLMTRLMADAPRTHEAVPVDLEHLAAIIYTSGVTENPKGVCLTHADLVANAVQLRHWIPELQYGRERVLSVVPLMHSYGLTTALNLPILMGATIMLLPVFEASQVLEQIRIFKPTLFPGVPSMYTAINQTANVREYGLASIKACISGAAPLPVEVQEAFEKLTRGRLVEGYGLTEASPVTHVNPFTDRRKSGSIGIPVPNTDAKIVDLFSGENLPPGQLGELVVKGPQVMAGYWNPAQQAPVIPVEVLRDDWLFTGDVAVMDQDGFFRIISRKRDTIFTGAYSVYPRDVEEIIYEHNKVLEVAVVGVTSGNDPGQKVKAFVVPRPGVTLSADELLALCRRRLEPYAVPWEIEFRPELPKSFMGKVLRRMLTQPVTPKDNT